MKYVKQFGIILFLSFVGEILHYLIPLPIPASIYGIIILLLGLETKWIPLNAVEETGRFLIEIMPIMFIPAAVGLLDSWKIIKPAIIPYLVITVISTCIVILVSGRVTQSILRRRRKNGRENRESEREETE